MLSVLLLVSVVVGGVTVLVALLHMFLPKKYRDEARARTERMRVWGRDHGLGD